VEEQAPDGLVGPLPVQDGAAGDGEEGQGNQQLEGEDEYDEEVEDPFLLPISHEVVLGSAHARGVTCMDIDHTGSRLITGSMDCGLRIYDFNGMKRDLKAFRCVWEGGVPFWLC
jgi:WD40 repeat protein